MKALSIKQPWAWAIVSGLKDIENRSWQTPYRGPILIHAGLRDDPAGYAFLSRLGIVVPATMQRGGIIGLASIRAISRDDPSQWAIPGCWHWRITGAQPLPFQPVKGQLGLFQVGPRPQQSLRF